MVSRHSPRSRATRLALIGSDSLLGHDIKEVLEAGGHTLLLDEYAANAEGSFGEADGEPVFRQPLDAAALAGAAVVVSAGVEAGARKAYELIKARGGAPRLIDCTGWLDQQPEARIVAPLVAGHKPSKVWLQVVAHPAAAIAALVLKRLAARRRIERAVLEIFEPASELGRRGIGELQQQTASLLTFRPLQKDVFDAQLSFNLLPALGEQAPMKLTAIEQRIETHLAILLARSAQEGLPVPMPSLRLIQAPVFHGYSLSFWIEFAAVAAAGEICETLNAAHIDVRGEALEPPSNVGAAGQSGVTAGDIRVDRNNPRAAWLWVAADNLRLTADSVASLIGTSEASKA